MRAVATGRSGRFTPCHYCPLARSQIAGTVRINPEVGKVRGCHVYIRTPAYLNLRNVSTVKKLLDCTTTDRLLVEQ